MQISQLRNLTDRNVIITGASSGIGSKVAYQLAKKGANLDLIARRVDNLTSVEQKCKALGAHSVSIHSLDVSNAKDVEATVEQIISKDGHIDILINAAGFGDFSKFENTNYSLWTKMFKVNVLGTMLMCRLIAANMIDNDLGQIINIGSMGGKIATPKSTIYSASKAAVIAFSNSLRLELRPLNIQVTTINPGPVKTDFFKIADHTGTYIQSVGKIMLDPTKLAKEIVNCIGRPVRELNRPRIMELGHIAYELMPWLGDLITESVGNLK